MILDVLLEADLIFSKGLSFAKNIFILDYNIILYLLNSNYIILMIALNMNSIKFFDLKSMNFCKNAKFEPFGYLK